MVDVRYGRILRGLDRCLGEKGKEQKKEKTHPERGCPEKRGSDKCLGGVFTYVPALYYGWFICGYSIRVFYSACSNCWYSEINEKEMVHCYNCLGFYYYKPV